MKEKLITAKNELLRQIKKLSITFTLLINLGYIGYLSYSLTKDAGNKIINIALIVGTAVFLLAYLFIQLIGQKKKGQLKSTKRAYKRFKMVTKVFTTATALYSLSLAADSSSKIALILTSIGAAFLCLKIIVEIISELIKRKVKKVKEEIAEKRQTKKMEAIEKRESKKMEKALAKKPEKKKKSTPTKATTDEESAEDLCTLSAEDLD